MLCPLASWPPPSPLAVQRSLAALEELWGEGYFRQPEGWRLAFREFGSTLGVQVRVDMDAAGSIPSP